ncbi:DUF2079 domain-containing protein [Embleya sp. NBC_00888]|uniref:DUF2079 domain-containing protein n=1 Tax=Embleya sp. NBC_00888 TaxID=2975960 RepID=UPI0038688958|nr:DUF2079 domain-containing protein [Embleya sp. NBC_00888]
MKDRGTAPGAVHRRFQALDTVEVAASPAAPAVVESAVIAPRTGEHDRGLRTVVERARRRIGSGILPYLLAALFFVIYTTHSLLRHRRMETHAYDLGLFEQVVRAYSNFQAPVSDIRAPDFNVLGEHFHPILALLGPIYRVFPGPSTLLVAQAFLIAISVVPITRIAGRAFGPWGTAALGIAYGLSWGIQSAVSFDFHEIAFAVPLLAFGLDRFLLGRYLTAMAWWLPLILVKEDLGLTFAAAAVPLLLLRRWKMAAAHVLIGASAFALAIFVLLPAINPNDTYAFWGNLDSSQRSGNADPTTPLGRVPISELIVELPKSMVLPSVKWMTLFTLLLPTGFIALRSPILAMIVPTMLWRFTSSNEYYWGTYFHYSAVLMPIVFAAFVDGVVRLRASRVHWLRRYAVHAAIVPLAVSLAFARDFPLMDLLHKRTYTVPDRVRSAHKVLDRVPDGATVSATMSFSPQLVSRAGRVTDFPTLLPGRGYAAIEVWGNNKDWARYWIAYLIGQGFTEVAREPGAVLLKRD